MSVESLSGNERSTVDPGRLIFVGGLHRSGTTVLGRILADHPDVSGFEGTGAPEDEGQHLQSVYPPAMRHGGPGRFARAPGAHLREASELEASDQAARLLSDWIPYWNLTKPFLVEKSPPNLIMGRYLQSLFPGSALIVILRHPVVVALSTKKWAPRTSLARLVEHWFIAHETLQRDLPNLARCKTLRYEDLLGSPDATLAGLQAFLGLASPLSANRLEPERSNRYVEAWDSMTRGPASQRRHRTMIENRYGARMQDYGYRVDDLSVVDPGESNGS